jgi:hypothetical protein
MEIKTKNFNPQTDPRLLCTCGHPKCDKRSVNQETLNNIQLVRDDIKRSMTITSGGRCPYHPNEIHKTKEGDHQKCTTVDVECHDLDYEVKLMVLAGRHGATRVAGGAYCGFVHMSWTETERTDVPTWEY